MMKFVDTPAKMALALGAVGAGYYVFIRPARKARKEAKVRGTSGFEKVDTGKGGSYDPTLPYH